MTIPEVKQTDGAFTFLPIEDVFYGVDSINNLDEVLAKYNIQRALLITGGTLFNKTALVDSVLNAANGRVTAVFHETKPHVPRGVVLKCIEIARKENVDAVISFGGGSPNDSLIISITNGINTVVLETITSNSNVLGQWNSSSFNLSFTSFKLF